MLYSALGFFALAAVGGLYLLSFILKNKKTPNAVVIGHGVLAATGITLLIIYPFYHSTSPIASLIVFILAAFGGLTLLYKGLSGEKLPKWLALGHGFTALVGLALLALFIFVR